MLRCILKAGQWQRCKLLRGRVMLGYHKFKLTLKAFYSSFSQGAACWKTKQFRKSGWQRRREPLNQTEIGKYSKKFYLAGSHWGTKLSTAIGKTVERCNFLQKWMLKIVEKGKHTGYAIIKWSQTIVTIGEMAYDKLVKPKHSWLLIQGKDLLT